MRNIPIFAAGLGLLVTLPAAGSPAGPVALELRAGEGVTELVIPGADVRASTLRLEACATVLRVAAPGGLDLDAVGQGDARIKGVTRAGADELVVATSCGAGLELRRRAAEVALVVGPVPVPLRKPAIHNGLPETPLAVAVAEQPVPTTAPQAAPADPSGGDAAFARAAIAAGLDAADREPGTEPAAPSEPASLTGDAPPRMARPSPAWGRGPALFKLAQWRTAPFRAERDRLRALIDGTAEEPAAAAAFLELARLMLAWGLGPEALAHLTEGEGPASKEARALAAAAAVLARPEDPAADWFSTLEALSHADGPLWAAVAAVRRGQPDGALVYLPAARKALTTLPDDLRRGFALDLLAASAAAGLDGFAREMARAVEEGAPDGAEQALLHRWIGELHAAAGRNDLALGQWDRAAELPGEGAMTSRILAAGLRHRLGVLDTSAYRTVLTDTVGERRGGALEFLALSRLAALEQTAGNVADALRTLRLLGQRHPAHPELAGHVEAAGSLMMTLVSPDSEIPLATRIAAFEVGRPLLGDGPAAWTLRRAYAGMLATSGLPALAREEWALLAAEMPVDERQPVLLALASLHLADGAADEARAVLEEEGAGAPDKTAWTALKARALTAGGNPAAALDLLAAAEAAPALAARADALWHLGRWAAAATAYGELAPLQPLTEGEVARQALAGYLAGDATAPADILARHAGAMAAGPWADRLRVLAAGPGGWAPTDAAVRALLADSRALARAVPARSVAK